MPGVSAKGNPFGGLILARYVVALMGCIGLAIVYGLNVNLSVAIVSMVNHTAIDSTMVNLNRSSVGSGNDSNNCGGAFSNESHTITQDGPFEWSPPLQGTILSSYFWGYLVSQMPGGRMSELFSSKWTMFGAVTINIAGTLLTPIASYLHHYALIVIRVIEGAGAGLTFPAMHVLLANWAPPSERNVMSSVCYAGTALGTVISMLLSGIIAGKVNWEAVFYIQGALSVPWLILWAYFIADTPLKQPFINVDELEYIVNSLDLKKQKQEPKSVPWRSVFTSTPFLAILAAHTLSGWGWYMVLIELPYYMKTALGFDINENATMIALPFLTLWVFSMVLSKILDWLRYRRSISMTTARKIGTGFASFIPMVCFVAIIYAGCHKGIVVLLMTLAITCCGGAFCGFMTNHIDISPNFAGTLMAITNTIATLPGIFVPLFVGKVTENDAGVQSWSMIFWVTAAFYLAEFVVYTIFGSGQEQSWNRTDTADFGEAQPLKTPATAMADKKFQFDNIGS